MNILSFNTTLYSTLLFIFLGCGNIDDSNSQENQKQETPTITEDVNSETTQDTINQTDYKKKFVNYSNCNQIVDKEFLYICYDHNLKVAKAVAYTLYGDLVDDLNIQKRPSFYEEESIAIPYRAKVKDYSKSGYDRGHMAPDAAFDWSQESLESTYSLANIIPQIPEVNQQAWVEVEKYARVKAKNLFELNVVNVIKYSNSPNRIGKSLIAVSVGYYKILYNSNEKYEECFYYPNNKSYDFDNDKLESHRVNCGDISVD